MSLACSCVTSWRIKASNCCATCNPICRRSSGRRAAIGAGIFEFDSECSRSDARRRHADHQIPCSCRAATEQVAVEFKDTGKGMSKELQKRAFKAVLATTKAKGSGLGLAIVGRIIETHRGQILVSLASRSRHGHPCFAAGKIIFRPHFLPLIFTRRIFCA